jgi:hypothetical protein
MALIVSCKNIADTIEALRQITKAIESDKVPDWERVGTNCFRNVKKEYRDKAMFSPIIQDNKLYFGLLNLNNKHDSLTQEIYDNYHSMFYRVLVRFSWKLYFTVEQSPDRFEDIDSGIAS